MHSTVLWAMTVLVVAPQAILAAHTLTFVNGCEETITPGCAPELLDALSMSLLMPPSAHSFKKQGTGATLGDPIAPGGTWSTELEDSWESGRFWALTQAGEETQRLEPDSILILDGQQV